jgi:hypothetical protein
MVSLWLYPIPSVSKLYTMSRDNEAYEAVIDTVAKMILSGGDVSVKHGIKGWNRRYQSEHDIPVITVTCKKTFEV